MGDVLGASWHVSGYVRLLMRWPRYSEHPRLQQVRVAAMILAIVVLLTTLAIALAR